MALIAVAADKGAPGVTTAAVALAAVWPRHVLLAECDPAGGDLVYRLPGADGGRLDPRRGLLSLAVAARRGLRPQQVWEHAQKLRGGLDVLLGVTNAEQGGGLEPLWGQVGAVLSGLPQADVIADCGRLGADGPFYDLLGRAAVVILVTRATLGEMVRLRDRVLAVSAAVRRRGGPGTRVGVLVVADHKSFSTALAEVGQALGRTEYPVSVIGGIAHEPKSAEMLRGEWGGKLDKSLLIRTAREVAGQLVGQLAAAEAGGAALPAGTRASAPAAPAAAGPGRAAPGGRGPVPPNPVPPAPMPPAPMPLTSVPPAPGRYPAEGRPQPRPLDHPQAERGATGYGTGERGTGG